MSKLSEIFTPEDVQLVFQFLDRAEIKGHQERAAMNGVINKLSQYASAVQELANQPQEPAKEEEPSPKLVKDE